MGKLLSVKNLSVEFPNKKSRLTAVKGESALGLWESPEVENLC